MIQGFGYMEGLAWKRGKCLFSERVSKNGSDATVDKKLGEECRKLAYDFGVFSPKGDKVVRAA